MYETNEKSDIKRICVIDGQGGGIGSTIIKKLRDLAGERIEIVALGTNAIVQTAGKVDVIIGTISIVMANSMMGEVTPRMAEAVASSPAKKILLPLSQENVDIVGISSIPLPHLIETLIQENLKTICKEL
jgi:hypothetical protein